MPRALKFSVFISYSNKDKEIASRIARDLADAGLNVWFDEWSISVGDSLPNRIRQGIRTADLLLVLISQNSLESRWVSQEIRTAIVHNPEAANTKIIPVLLENVERKKIPSFLRNIVWVDLSRGYRKGIESILKVAKNPSRIAKSPRELVNVNDLAKEVAKEVGKLFDIDNKGVRRPEPYTEEVPSNLVFVIISFSSDMDPIFEGIKAAAEKNGLVAKRVKDVQGDYRITDKIIEMIRDSRLIVADLTYERPNVYFELGYARGLCKTIISTARDRTKLHFDIKDWTCQFYGDSRVIEKYLTERFAYELKRS